MVLMLQQRSKQKRLGKKALIDELVRGEKVFQNGKWLSKPTSPKGAPLTMKKNFPFSGAANHVSSLPRTSTSGRMTTVWWWRPISRHSSYLWSSKKLLLLKLIRISTLTPEASWASKGEGQGSFQEHKVDWGSHIWGGNRVLCRARLLKDNRRRSDTGSHPTTSAAVKKLLTPVATFLRESHLHKWYCSPKSTPKHSAKWTGRTRILWASQEKVVEYSS